MHPSILLIFIILFLNPPDTGISEFEFLLGTWKVEEREQFEVWELTVGGELHGTGYRIREGVKEVFETLSIKKRNGQIIYEATVPGQNEGKTITFILNPENTSGFSFENMDHDFPKKILYKKISTEEIEVSVTGDNDKGFKLTLKKQIH